VDLNASSTLKTDGTLIVELAITADPWQVAFLKEEHRRTLLLASRPAMFVLLLVVT
jgi:hypothetical protein